MISTIREPVVAGRFYPGNQSSIRVMIDQLLHTEIGKIYHPQNLQQIIGGIVPHAGYVYSGYEAVHFYEILKQSKQHFETAVIINPNHTGMGTGMFNSCSYSSWNTPLGNIETDAEFRESLGITPYNQAHDREHSGEVQLPFLQYFLPFSFKLVAITMNHQNIESAAVLADKIVKAATVTSRKIIVIASSDFNHYEPPVTGFKKDQYVVDSILKFDAAGVYYEVKKHQVSACGFGPIMTLLNYSLLIDKSPVIKLLKRGHSGEIYPSDNVVDYASFICFKQKWVP